MKVKFSEDINLEDVSIPFLFWLTKDKTKLVKKQKGQDMCVINDPLAQ